MIKAEHIHDALSLLPEELLTPVDALRRKKRFSWKPVAALAACFALVVGLWSLFPGVANSMDNPGAAPENGSGDGFLGAVTDQNTQHSTGTTPFTATVLEIEEDRMIVLPGETLTDIAQPVTVLLDGLEDIPPLEKGQSVRIYCKDVSDPTVPLIPYRIEIANNEQEE